MDLYTFISLIILWSDLIVFIIIMGGKTQPVARKPPPAMLSEPFFSGRLQYHFDNFQAYFETHAAKDTGRKKGFIYLTSGMTCKKIHSEYNSYCQIHVPGI
jgi:hypothetical protein